MQPLGNAPIHAESTATGHLPQKRQVGLLVVGRRKFEQAGGINVVFRRLVVLQGYSYAGP
jgi:hypothetical protein